MNKIYTTINLVFIVILTSVFACGDGMNVLMEDPPLLEELSGTDDQMKVSTPSISPNGGIYNSDQSVNISCPTGGVTIYYTTDGSDPDDNTALYTGPIAVSGNGTNMTIKAIAFKVGLTESDIDIKEYSINYDQVSTLVVSPVGGIYNYDQNVSISCATAGATIYYTTDGSNPDGGSTVYSGPIPVAGNGANMTIKAITLKSGMLDSAIATEAYTINYDQVATPSMSPASGTYNSDQSVAIACATIGATIYYTTDGSDPDGGSTVYSGPISITGHGATMTIKAIALKGGMLDSSIRTEVYTIQYDQVTTPVMSPISGTYNTDQSVNISCATGGATIYYTTDGTDPDGGSAIYFGSISVAGHGTSITIKAIAVKSGMIDSSIATEAYTIQYDQVATPVMGPVGGTYSSDQNVSVTCATGGVTIYYTTDGSDPDIGSAIYSGTISVAGNGTSMTIKAIAMKSGMANSAIASEAYSIVNPTQTVDSTGYVGRRSSIAVDGQNVYVSYYDYTNGYLRFVRSTNGGASWTNMQTVDSIGIFSYNDTSIAVNESNIYIAYYDFNGGNLKFARSTDSGVTWPDIQTIDSTGDVGRYVSIAVSGSNIYISYFNASNADLKFARSTDNGSTWPAIQTVDSAGVVGQYTSIGTSGTNVYISYFDNANADLKFARSTDSGSTWPTIQTVDSIGSVGEKTSIVASGTVVYISYYDSTNGSLKVAGSSDSGSVWSNIQTVDSTGDVGDDSSIVLDGSNIYISYYDSSNYDLKFARSTDSGSTWPVIQTVDSSGYLGSDTSIGVNGLNIYISYYSATGSALKIAISNDGGVTW